MPRSDAFKQGQKNRPKLDPYSTVAKVGIVAEPEENMPEAEPIAAEVVPTPPPPQPQSEPLPPWLQHFKMIPIDQIRPGRYQTRMLNVFDSVEYKQLVDQLRFDYKREKLRLLVFVMPDPNDEAFYNPSRGMHLRVQAAKEIGVPELLCCVADYDQEDLAYGTLFENLARRDLNIIEQGLMFLLFKHDFGMEQDDIAIKYHVPGGRDHVARCIQAAQAASDIQKMILQDPGRSMRVVTYLSRLDNLRDAEKKRAPIIQGFLEKKLTADMVEVAVNKVRDGYEFILEEQSGNSNMHSNAISFKVIGRIERAIATRKKLDLYLREIKNETPSSDERAELESIQSTIIAILSR